MPTNTRRFAVTVDARSTYDAAGEGLLKLVELCAETNQNGLIVLPNLHSLETDIAPFTAVVGEAAADALRKGHSVTLPSGHEVRIVRSGVVPATGEVVLAVFLGPSLLEEVDDKSQGPAIVAVEWEPGGTEKWQREWEVTLVGDGHTTSPPTVSSVVDRALSLIDGFPSIDKDMAIPDAKKRAAEMFKMVRLVGGSYESEAVRVWALQKGYTHGQAKKLADVAASVAKQAVPKSFNTMHWNPAVMDELRTLANDGGRTTGEETDPV